MNFFFEGRPWPLIFTHRALLACQDLTGVDMLSARLTDLSASMIRALLFAALEVAGAQCSIGDVGKAVVQSNIGKVKQALFSAWAASMADPEPNKSGGGETQEFTWLEAWAMAREELRLSDGEWLDMTPRQFRALQKVRLERLQREELLVGIIASTVENFSMCAPRKAVTPESFMLHKFPPKQNPDVPDLNNAERISWSAETGLQAHRR